MGKREKLLKQAISGPVNMRFEDLCALAECFGFILKKSGGGSHRVYQRKGVARLPFQSDGGKAKPYQIKQLLDVLRELGEIE